MAILPTTRQKVRKMRRRTSGGRRLDAKQSLVNAFGSFSQAAESLEKSYRLLQMEVARMGGELECANAELSRSLEENKVVRRFLSQILEGLPCGVLVFDQEHRLRVINPEARRLLALPADWSAESAEALPAVVVHLAEKPGEATAALECEWRLDGPNGTRTLYLAQASVTGEGDIPTGSICILRDATEQMRLASEREELRRSQALAEIATVLAHEIRNPLGSLELFAGLLADSIGGSSEAGRWVGHIQAGLRTLSATVNNVLQFHSQPCPEPIPTQINRLLKETVEFLSPLARQRGMHLRLENLAEPAVVSADPHRLQQVFLNLALNSFRAMSPGGALLVSACRTATAGHRQVRIDFEDQGVGIPPEQIERLFDPGFTTHAGSPGLGLSVCRKVIEQHRGTIRVQSVPRLGSTFTVTLPESGEMA